MAATADVKGIEQDFAVVDVDGQYGSILSSILNSQIREIVCLNIQRTDVILATMAALLRNRANMTIAMVVRRPLKHERVQFSAAVTEQLIAHCTAMERARPIGMNVVSLQQDLFVTTRDPAHSASWTICDPDSMMRGYPPSITLIYGDVRSPDNCSFDLDSKIIFVNRHI